MNTSNNKTIAKNTAFLYFRMMITMFISLYTSRVVLLVLGVEDFGLYTVIGGFVGMFSFLNGALSGGSSRFLTFELGVGNFEKLQKTFSTLLNTHIIIAIIVVILAETVGLWFVYNKLAIPLDRMNAALWVYHISVLTSVITMTQVPYNASIISHEKMDVFAYVSIVEVSLKLGIVYLLKIGDYDKLVLYAILLCIITIGIALFYRFYCILKFKETNYKFILDKNTLKSVSGFSGWSLLSQISVVLNSQGINVIASIFFGPAIVAARAISIQVEIAALQLMQNFRTAVNPQIIKKYAAKNYDASKQLLLTSTKFSFYLMFLLGLPIILLAEPLLQLWLGQVPEYSVIFLQLIIIQSLFSVFNTSFITAIHAKGQLKEAALVVPIILFVQFVLVYILFKVGYSPIVMSYAGIVTNVLLGLVIRPILVCRIVNYTFRDIMNTYIPCIKVCLIAIPIPVVLNYYLDKSLLNFFVICLVSSICIFVAVFYFGIDHQMRYKIVCITKEKLQNRINKEK